MVTLFQPISTDAPPQTFNRVQHCQPPVGNLVWGPLQTNNSFSNLLLYDQTWPVWTHPYLIWFSKDGDEYHGMSVNHTERDQIVFGPPDLTPPQYFSNPVKIKLITFTGCNWKKVQCTVVNMSKLSATVKLSAEGCGSLHMPLVLGMGFATATYYDEIPVLHSAVGFQEMRQVGLVNGCCAKYWVKLSDQRVWTIYVSVDFNNVLILCDHNHIRATKKSTKCTIQVCKGNSVAFDSVCGIYPLSATLSGEVDPDKRLGTYSIIYSNDGSSSSGKGLVWALPHHQSTLVPEVQATFTGLTLDSTTKGLLKAYNTDSLKMIIPDLPIDIGFEPWTSVNGFRYDPANYKDSVKAIIRDVATNDANDDILGACDLDSMYFGGKQLDKYAYIAYVAKFILQDDTILKRVLPRIKLAIEKYARNFQKFPLCYDESWKGIISSASQELDFGNSNYNDHHFHYGYHIHAIALVSAVDKDWLFSNSNLVYNYAILLIRDYANPTNTDSYFPQFRCFDWFHGHSFAAGIYPSGDGKSEESSSEDYHSIHALKLFALITGNKELEMTANLVLGIMKNSLNRYFLFLSDNKDMPPQILPNKVSGILFENKIDYATYFGRGTIGDEYIHGIHMLPITSISSYIRGQGFVEEEWSLKLASIVDRIPDGWRGLLKLNQGLFDPKAAWKWFARSDWDPKLIDGGMSRTWSLAYLAGIGGAN
ncbi:glycoside hydrolase [Metschnikowia bicuspidata]|uniref:glucan endo-1,3-beta-D-glucosidase n=1 Tax=Metschnikowia bicuspidata TaxID=27322 RepID=A0A4P9Z909_9ASCO|nr:glycoside hydrolase [Metschnikowia bicuspidata]